MPSGKRRIMSGVGQECAPAAVPHKSQSSRVRAILAVLAFLLVLLPSGVAAGPANSAPAKNDSYYEPLPQETGANGLKLMLRKLETTGRLMQVDAHPDDEDGGMLTLEARGKGVSTLLMTLTRGEGGQNELGSNLFD